MKKIYIGKNFSETPVGRYLSDGPYSGEKFREEILHPALKENDIVSVVIDDAEGYGSSFLDEAFGGLVRKKYFTAAELEKKLSIECTKPDYLFYRVLIWKYIKEAQPA